MQCPHIMSAKNQFSVEHLFKPNQHPTPVSNILPQCSIWWQGHLRQPSSCWGKGGRPVPGFYVSQGILTKIIIILMRSSNLGEINPRGRALHKQHHQESARHHRTSDHRGTSHQYACIRWTLLGVPGGGEAGQALPSSPSQTKSDQNWTKGEYLGQRFFSWICFANLKMG